MNKKAEAAAFEAFDTLVASSLGGLASTVTESLMTRKGYPEEKRPVILSNVSIEIATSALNVGVAMLSTQDPEGTKKLLRILLNDVENSHPTIA